MKPKLILLFLFQSVFMLGQTELQNQKYNFEKDCGYGDEQTINICYMKAIKRYRYVITEKFDCIVEYLDAKIKFYSNNDHEIEMKYIKMKTSLITSHATWVQLKDQNSDFYIAYGDKVTSMSKSIIKDYKDRLTWLDNLIEEEGKGNETKILKCE